MALTSGSKLGPYEIVGSLGAGGMGEVYRAHDSRLDRDVAVKVLPAGLAADSSLRQRLEREAKSVSKLSHPHICALHDIGDQDGTVFLVMELLEGETLEQRLNKGPLPPEQTIRYGAQIADALSKAHQLGFTHRDLKPANIMLTKSGAKLMDFGLAKHSATAPLAIALTEMTAEQSKLTSDGMLVGTFQYMAPELLEGREADARTDIFALGEVLYEMATGKPAFNGKSRASIIASILTTEPPPITQLQPLAPPALERVVRKCLAKDPDERWQSASDLASELKWIAESASQPSASIAEIASRNPRRAIIGWALLALTFGVALTLVAVHLLEHARPPTVVRAVINPEEHTSPLFTGDFAGPMVISPDASALAYVASPEQGAPLLWIRKLNALHAHALPGTEGATFPFWSPDSRNLGFFAGGKLKTVLAEGGTPFEVCDALTPRGGTWSSRGIIVFAPTYTSTLSQVPATGGVPRPVTVMDHSKHDSHRWPRFLPDGDHFLYLAVSHHSIRDPNDSVYFASMDGKENVAIMRGHTEAVYAGGRLLYEREGVLMAQRFDPGKGNLQGEPERLAENVLQDSTTWKAEFDVTGNELLAYATGGIVPAQPMWYDRTGKELGPAGPKAFNLNSIRLSPDGNRLAIEAGEISADVWVYDLKRGVNTRLTFGSAGGSSSPVWSPDGQWIAYVGVGTNGGANTIYRRPANGGGKEEVLLEGDNSNRVLADWSPDSKSLLFVLGDLAATGEIWLVPLIGERKPVRLVQGNFVAAGPRFSPDGHWIAYSSTESGRSEVYVIPFGGGEGKWQISNTGGTQPVWRRDGRELFYWAADNSLMSISLSFKSGALEAGFARILSRWNNPVGYIGVSSALDVSNDGQRFVAISVAPQPSRPITLVTNWDLELKK